MYAFLIEKLTFLMLAESNETTRTENKLHQNYTFWCSSVRLGSVRFGSALELYLRIWNIGVHEMQ